VQRVDRGSALAHPAPPSTTAATRRGRAIGARGRPGDASVWRLRAASVVSEADAAAGAVGAGGADASAAAATVADSPAQQRQPGAFNWTAHWCASG
jgi:hypothetical protein